MKLGKLIEIPGCSTFSSAPHEFRDKKRKEKKEINWFGQFLERKGSISPPNNCPTYSHKC